MKTVRKTLDDWKAYVGELERKARKYEARHSSVSDALIVVESLLIDAHSVLTLAMMSPGLAREFDLHRRLTPDAAIEVAEDLLNKARCSLPRLGGANIGGKV